MIYATISAATQLNVRSKALCQIWSAGFAKQTLTGRVKNSANIRLYRSAKYATVRG